MGEQNLTSHHIDINNSPASHENVNQINQNNEELLIKQANQALDELIASKDEPTHTNHLLSKIAKIPEMHLKNVYSYVIKKLDDYLKLSAENSSKEIKKSIDMINYVIRIDNKFKEFVNALLEYFVLYKKYAHVIHEILNETKLELQGLNIDKNDQVEILNKLAEHLLHLIDDFNLNIEDMEILNDIKNNPSSRVDKNKMNKVISNVQSGIRRKIEEEFVAMKTFKSNIGLGEILEPITRNDGLNFHLPNKSMFNRSQGNNNLQ